VAIAHQRTHWHTTLEPGVRRIRLPHGVQVDAPFTRSNKRVRMRARFALVDPDRELAWTGSGLGSRVVHRITLEPRPDDTTKVVAEESMAGPLLSILFSTTKLPRRANRQPDNPASSGRDPAQPQHRRGVAATRPAARKRAHADPNNGSAIYVAPQEDP